MTKNVIEYYQLVFYLFFSGLLFILFIQSSTVMNGNNFFTLQFKRVTKLKGEGT